MQTIQDLVNFILQQDRCIVYGDLGRYPHYLMEALNSIPMLKVFIITQDKKLRSTNSQIRISHSENIMEKCDLLIYLEPTSLQIIQKQPLASHVVVFTSHFTFSTPCGEWWTNVCFFNKMDLEGIKELLERQDFPMQTRNIGLIEVDHANVLTITGKESPPPITDNTYVIVDLTNFTKEVLNMYLAFLDAFDYILMHRQSIHRWVICFPENGRQAFIRFTQKILDSLFCREFEHGNVIGIENIIALLPFYKSGTIDKKFDVKLSSFGGINFVAPKNYEDACKAAAMYNIYPIAKNVFGIQN